MNVAMLEQVAKADAGARLPAVYEQAVIALTECASIDECKDWADKAAAIASYSKQAGDQRLLNFAMRIKGRAVQRAGELMKEFDGTGNNQHTEGDHGKLTQRQIAAEAGLSEHQQLQAVRVANVPAELFEELIESESPPSVSELAGLGKKSRPAPERPPEFAVATQAIGAARRFVEHCEAHSADEVMRGLTEGERPAALALMTAIRNWTAAYVDQGGSL